MRIRLDTESERILIGALQRLANSGAGEDAAQDLHAAYGDGARAWVDETMNDLPGLLAERRAALAGFETRLIARWGEALDVFEFLLQTCQEIGQEFDGANRPMAVDQQSSKFEALSRLHAKGVLTASEILVLLRTGHSTAAMARWRTLHEAAVTAYVLAPEDEELARRYLAHRVVESYRAQGDYERFWSRLNAEPPDWTSSDQEETRQKLTEEFGKDFMASFGWAQSLFGRVPTFRDLEERAALDHLRPYYRIASHGIHTSSHGILWSLQILGDHDVLMAGPSNAGLTDPAHSAAISLGQLTTILLAYEMTERVDEGDDDPIVQVGLGLEMHVVMELVDRVGDSFLGVHAEQTSQQEDKERLVRGVVELIADRGTLDIEAVARERELTTEEVEDCVDQAIAQGLITRVGRFGVTDVGRQFLARAHD